LKHVPGIEYFTASLCDHFVGELCKVQIGHPLLSLAAFQVKLTGLWTFVDNERYFESGQYWYAGTWQLLDSFLHNYNANTH